MKLLKTLEAAPPTLIRRKNTVLLINEGQFFWAPPPGATPDAFNATDLSPYHLTVEDLLADDWQVQRCTWVDRL